MLNYQCSMFFHTHFRVIPILLSIEQIQLTNFSIEQTIFVLNQQFLKCFKTQFINLNCNFELYTSKKEDIKHTLICQQLNFLIICHLLNTSKKKIKNKSKQINSTQRNEWKLLQKKWKTREKVCEILFITNNIKDFFPIMKQQTQEAVLYQFMWAA